MARQTGHASRADGTAKARGRPPADAGGRRLLERMRALADSVRRQMAARRRNRTRPGGPGEGVGPR